MGLKLSGLGLVCVISLFGCAALTAPLYSSLNEGEGIPEGKVLVIGKVVLDPEVEQGPIRTISVKGSTVGVIKFYLTDDLSQPVDREALNPVSPNEIIDVKLKGLSVIPMPSGTRYIRVGSILARAVFTGYSSTGGIPSGPRAIDSSQILLFGDIKLSIPEKAKAVYIGSIIYRHDGQRATGIRIKDEFKQALQELAAQKIPGIRSKDVVKRLAMISKTE